MPRCAIFTCKNYSGQKNLYNGGVSYHRFPQDPSIKEKWIDATGRQNWMPSKLSTICSEHFDEKDILISKKGLRYLSGNAVPVNKILIFQDLEHGAEHKPEFFPKRSGDMTSPPGVLPTKMNSDFESDIDMEASTRKKTLRQMLKYSESKLRKKTLKVKRLQGRNRLLQKKIKKTEDLLKSVQQKYNISDQELELLKKQKFKGEYEPQSPQDSDSLA